MDTRTMHDRFERALRKLSVANVRRNVEAYRQQLVEMHLLFCEALNAYDHVVNSMSRWLDESDAVTLGEVRTKLEELRTSR